MRALVLLALLLPSLTWAVPAVVQNGGLTNVAGSADGADTFNSTPTAGNMVVVTISGWHSNSFDMQNGDVTDNKGNTYVRAVQNVLSQGLTNSSIFYAENIVSSATFTVTVSPQGASANYFHFVITEVSGVVTTSALDQTASSNHAGSNSPTTGNTSATTVADSIVFAVLATNGNSANDGIDVPADTGYTNLGVYQASNTIIGHSSDYKIVSSTGVQSAAWGTLGGAYPWTSAIATFKGGSGASPAVLSAATPSGTLGTSTTATLGATTDVTSGTFYGVVDTVSLAGITGTQIKAAQDAGGGAVIDDCNAAVSTTTPSCGITGLTAATAYNYAVVQNSAGGDSNVLTGSFTTAAASSTKLNPMSGRGGTAAQPITN